MNYDITAIKALRTSLLRATEGLTTDQLNTIPEGFNNNIIWNMAHVIATQQAISYKRTGQPILVSEEYFEAYKSGTRPTGTVTEEFVEQVRGLLVSTIDQLDADFDNNIFTKFTPFVTGFGIPVDNIGEALNFLKFHEGFHLGYVMALKKLVK